jgi:hypothetical protein
MTGTKYGKQKCSGDTHVSQITVRLGLFFAAFADSTSKASVHCNLRFACKNLSRER